MNTIDALVAEALAGYSAFVVLALVVARLLGKPRGPGRRISLLAAVAATHLACLLAAVIAERSGFDGVRAARIATQLTAAWVVAGALGTVLFSGVLPRLRIASPAILRDLTVGAAGVVASLLVAGRAGFDLSSLLATSAVLTAVIGFAMQDTLGNLVSGLALQLDNSLQVGDWVQIDGRQGWIVEINWRYTAVQTRDWDTILIPNSQLTRSQVVVLGRRDGQPRQMRRLVQFDVDFRFSPTQVIAAVQAGLRAAPIRLVAAKPAPAVEVLEFKDGYARFGAFFWQTDLTDVVDSDVRERIFAALQRARIPMAIPPRQVSATIEDEALRTRQRADDLEARVAAVDHVELFSGLTADDRTWLAAQLHRVTFVEGEALTRQGETSASLFVVVEGQVSVRVASDGLEREIAKLGAGQFFGEMALLTGEARVATVVAVGEAACFRLDRGPAEELLRRRPELAESMAELLARRRLELAAAKGELDHEARERHLRHAAGDLLGRIRAAFRLEHKPRAAAS